MAYLIGVVPQRGRQAPAIAVVWAEQHGASGLQKNCAVEHLEAGALDWSHEDLIDRVKVLVRAVRYQDAPRHGSPPFLIQTALDATTLGGTSLRLWRQAGIRPLKAIEVATANHGAAKPGCIPITRKELLDRLNVALQAKRLQVASALELAAELRRQLSERRIVKPPAVSDTGDLDADEVADNLVLAVALAVWDAEHSRLEASPPGPIVASTSFNPFVA